MEQVAEPVVDSEQIRHEVLAEKKGLEPEGKKPWEARLEKDHPTIDFTPKKKEEEQVKEVEKETTSEEQPADPEAAPAEKQPAEEAQPVEAKKDTAKEEDAYIAEYAKSNGINEDEAKEEVGKLRSISKKYGDDPVKIAKAYREVQSAYDKQKVTASSNINPAVAQIAANPRSYVLGEVKKNQDKLIVEFREQNPARSRDMDDEQVVEEIVERGTYAIKDQIRSHEIRLKQEATAKREEFIQAMPEADKRYLPEIKPVLDQLPDWQVVGPTFKYEDLVSWAKGKSVDRLVKEAEDRVRKEYESKDRKIVGEISRPAQATKVKQAVEQSKGAGLTRYQQDQARQMFASMNDDDAFAAYVEVNQRKKK